jgi:hypothetical protein
MIQRKQTLFLILLVLTSAALLIVPCNFVSEGGGPIGVSFLSTYTIDIIPNLWHYIGLAIDVSILLLAAITIFLFKRRRLQVQLCYTLMLLQLGLTCIISFASTVVKSEITKVENSGIATIISVVGILSAYFAAHYIKKDIELLKSADRIR